MPFLGGRSADSHREFSGTTRKALDDNQGNLYRKREHLLNQIRDQAERIDKLERQLEEHRRARLQNGMPSKRKDDICC